MKKIFYKLVAFVLLIFSCFPIYSCNTHTSKFEYNLSMQELEKRTNENYLFTKKFLTEDSEEYVKLKEGDKQALKYLVKAATYIDKIFLKTDNCHNIDIKNWLEEEVKKSDKKAILTMKLFDAQKGVEAIDYLANHIKLIKNIDVKIGKGFYPEDLTKEEFHSILTNMINEGKIEQVKIILNQRSIVVRDGNELKGIDYVDYFKYEFENIALCLEEAAKTSTDKDFNEYLKLQVDALRKADPMLDAYADKKWAELQYTPLEFTITRENYDDQMMTTIAENEALSKLLKDNNINALPKDSLGARVGIVNFKGTDDLLVVKNYLPFLASKMPFCDEYEQSFLKEEDVKQTMVDVDLVKTTGRTGSYRGGTTVAENLPNSDKLSLTIGGGRRNVYHRQIRFTTDEKKSKDKIEAILDKDQYNYYNEEAKHWNTILHENSHSLGPALKENKLGKYKNILEESKADMAALSFIDELNKQGLYTDEQRNQIIVTVVLNSFLKAKPDMTKAHRVRTVMQNKFLFDNGAYIITKDGKVHVNIDKVCSIARKMLENIIRIQIDGDIKKAEDFVNKTFVWTNEMEIVSKKIQQTDTYLNGTVENKLADYLLKDIN